MELLFKNWILKEQSMKSRLVIFDFDGTVAKVPERPETGDEYWDGRDWWGSEASLSSPHYDGSVHPEVIEAFKQAKADPNAHTILLTGRRGVIAHGVRNILRSHGLYGKRVIHDDHKDALSHYKKMVDQGKDVSHPDESHEEYYSGDWITHPDYPTKNGKKGLVKDGSTFAHKRFVIENLIKKNGGFQIIEIWDDRVDHLELFIQIGKNLLSNKKVSEFVIHQVYDNGTIKHMELGSGKVKTTYSPWS